MRPGFQNGGTPHFRSMHGYTRSMVTLCSCAAGLFERGFESITVEPFEQGRSAMQALIEFIAGFVAMLAAAALSQFGVDLDPRQAPQREIHRVRDCSESPSVPALTASTERKQDC
ncbi:MAG: hypothetical protein ACOVQF_05120 [Brevundimonas sp.]|jgi:hypothetical protein